MLDERPRLLVPESSSIRLSPAATPLAPLPRPPTTFVGRERELAMVLELLGKPGIRLLTLVGPGGVGKTRLALAAARQLEPGFPDGIAFVAFDATTDVAQVPVLVAQAAGVPDGPGRSLPQRIQDHVRQRQMLLVLDNLEHLPGVEEHVRDLIAGSERLHVLCTSRVALGIASEQVYPVPPLDPVDAVRLFGERARAAEPGFRGDDHDPGTVTRICEQLECVPLAIELAAARTTVLTLPALLARLEHQLPLLVGGPRDAPARQRAMRDTIAWSYDLLDPADRVLLRRLAVCSGGFSLDAAQVIANDGVDALDGVSRLVAAGLVRRVHEPAGETRFRLPVTIREYAFDLLTDAGERDAARTQHSHYYRDLAERAMPYFDGPGLATWMGRIVAERDNCRAAMAWAMESGDWETAIRLAGALWRTWWASEAIGGKTWTEAVEEGLTWIERTLPHRGELPVEALAEALIGAGALTNKLGRLPESRRYAEELLRLSEAQGYPYGEYWACFQIGRARQDSGELDLAQTWLTRAVDVAPRMRDAENHASMALGCLADVARDRGGDREALRLAMDGLQLARSCGNPHLLSWLGLVAGRLCHKLGDQAQAARLLIEGAEAYDMNQDPGGVRAALTELGRVAMALNRLDTATDLLVAVHDLPAHDHDRPVHDAALTSLAAKLKTSPATLVAHADPGVKLDILLDLARSLATEPPPSPPAAPGGLTPRELEVLRLLTAGKFNRQIAEQLSLSERTVENHVFHILAKLGLDSRTAAATWAVRNGLDRHE